MIEDELGRINLFLKFSSSHSFSTSSYFYDIRYKGPNGGFFLSTSFIS